MIGAFSKVTGAPMANRKKYITIPRSYPLNSTSSMTTTEVDQLFQSNPVNYQLIQYNYQSTVE